MYLHVSINQHVTLKTGKLLNTHLPLMYNRFVMEQTIFYVTITTKLCNTDNTWRQQYDTDTK